MNSVPETPEAGKSLKAILREQGRSMTWLAQETGATYPQVVAYLKGVTRPPSEWVERARALLGEGRS